MSGPAVVSHNIKYPVWLDHIHRFELKGPLPSFWLSVDNGGEASGSTDSRYGKDPMERLWKPFIEKTSSKEAIGVTADSFDALAFLPVMRHL